MVEWQTIISVAVAGLTFKIVFDWLKGRKEPKRCYCPLHVTHHEQIEKLERCSMVLKQDVSKHDVIITERTTEIFKKLDVQDRKLSSIQEAMARIGASLAALAEHHKD